MCKICFDYFADEKFLIKMVPCEALICLIIKTKNIEI